MTDEQRLRAAQAALCCEEHIGLCGRALHRRMMDQDGIYTEPFDVKRRLAAAIDELTKALHALDELQ